MIEISHFRFVRLVVAVVLLTLGGCYFANQPRLERTVHDHCQCSGTSPVDCSRLRQSLMPYSCVERVRLYSSGKPPVVDAIEVPKIACTGL
jgi:hypothetical protein